MYILIGLNCTWIYTHIALITFCYLNEVTACLTLFPFYDWFVWRQEYYVITNVLDKVLFRLVVALNEAA